MAMAAGRQRKGARAASRKATGKRGRAGSLSPADIAELAGQMRIPEGILELVLARYPELARPLTRHRDLVA